MKGYKIAYLDFTSMYPTVMANNIMPFGRHKRWRPPPDFELNLDNIDKYFGFIYCKIEPPKDLLIPLLFKRTDSKLTFPLTSLVNTYCSVEIKEALQLGYKI